MTWDLGERRDDWKRWIKEALAANGSKQAAVAAAITTAVGDGASKTTALNKFIAGDEDTLRSWFEDHLDWVEILAMDMDRDVSELLSQLRAFTGTSRAVSAWHECFPDLTLDEVEVATPFDGPLGSDPSAVAAAWVADVRTRSGGKPDALAVVAPSGAAREIAARQVCAAVSALVGDQPVQQSPKAIDGTWTIIPAERAPDSVHRVVRLRPWGQGEIVALATRVAASERTPPSHRAPLRELGTRLSNAGGDTALDLAPDLAIRLVAEVARSGCPANVASIRRLVTAGAWRRVAAACDRLQAFDERLVERYFAGLALRTRGPEERGSWYVVPRAVAETLLREAAVADHGELAGAPVAALIEVLVAAKGEKARQAAAQTLREAAESQPGAALLDALVAGGILSLDDAIGRTWVRPTTPRLAAMWAARGLDGQVALAFPWTALCDRGWGELVEEQARSGLGWSTLLRSVQAAPSALAIDAAVVALRFALASPELVADEALTSLWATALWATAHGYLDLKAWGEPWGWGAPVKPLLVAFARRYRHQLPRMREDPLGQVQALVPPDALALIAAWRPTTTRVNQHQVVIGEHVGLLAFTDHSDRTSIIHALQDAAPDVFVYDSPNRHGNWGGLRSDAARRVIEEAERGDAACAAMLSGAALVAHDNKHEQNHAWHFWRALPWSVRVDWAARAGAGGKDGLRIFYELLRDKSATAQAQFESAFPRLLQVAERVGRDEMESACYFELVNPHGGDSLPGSLVFAIAERLGLVQMLDRVAARPFQLAGELVPELRDGFLRLGHSGGKLENQDSHQPRLPLRERLSEADALAGEAATLLHRLGRPEALRHRWLEDGPALPVEAVRAARRIEWLAHLAKSNLGMWRQFDVPLDALAGFADAPRGPHADHALYHLLGVPRAWGVEGELGEWLPDNIRRALSGLRALLYQLPEEFPPELDAAIDRAHPWAVPIDVEMSYAGLDEGRRIAAARALVLLGDDEPISIWASLGDQVRRDEEDPDCPGGGRLLPHQSAAIRVVMELIGSDIGVVERCWKALHRAPNASPPQATRRHLLARGSVPYRGEADPRLPLPFVVAEALTAAPAEEIEWLTQSNGRGLAWLPVVRQNLSKSSTPRTRARWALALAVLEPDKAALSEALDYWLHDDPSPWSGGGDWHRDEAAYVGGTRDLLPIALDRQGQRPTAGLVRLFQAALFLPAGGRWEDPDKAPEVLRLNTSDHEVPWPIGELAAALVERGRADVVLEVWRHPPPELPEGRAEQLRRWLEPHWLKLAPDDELRSLLWSPTHFNVNAAYTLLGRGNRDLAADAMRAAVELAYPRWNLLAEVAPERLGAALDARLAGPTPWRILVATFATAADEIASPAAAALARYAVANPRPAPGTEDIANAARPIVEIKESRSES